MKLVCCSDVHVDWSSGGVRRFDDLARAVHQVADVAIEQRADAFLMLGDWCNPDRGSAVFACVRLAIEVAQKLSAAHIDNHWLVGNHDVIEDGSGLTSLCPLGQLYRHDPRIQVHDRACVTPLRGGALLALPYTASSHPYDPAEAVATLAPYMKGVQVVIGHLMLDGILPGVETTDLPRGRDVVWPLAALHQHLPGALLLAGHYHRRQVFEGVQVVGSLDRLTFGEADHEPGYLVVNC